jgi:hypothetical protein
MDADDYRLQRGLQYQWYRDALELEPDSEYNTLGDCRTGRGAQSSDPAFTFYTPDLGTKWGAIGVKAMVPEDGRLDPDALDALSQMLKVGHTPSGTPVNTLRIIVPSRDMAIACYEQAKAAGAAVVMYPASSGMYDPFPTRKGGWLHEVDPVRGYRGVRRATEPS